MARSAYYGKWGDAWDENWSPRQVHDPIPGYCKDRNYICNVCGWRTCECPKVVVSPVKDKPSSNRE